MLSKPVLKVNTKVLADSNSQTYKVLAVLYGGRFVTNTSEDGPMAFLTLSNGQKLFAIGGWKARRLVVRFIFFSPLRIKSLFC